ncbi:MAG: hypothetical protein PUP91_12990 [Rhizonema sp. PD37]|nr:hypothetical protein [Rhizonema sp. PD37]
MQEPMDAILEPALEEDMPDNWTFIWREIWSKTNFEYQKIIKFSYQGSILGLIRYAVYLSENDIPYLLEVLHLESVPTNKKLVEPIGKWLLWYAIRTGLKFCTPEENGALISLDSVEDAIAYYRDIIKMEAIGWVTIAPGEDGYAFQFTVAGARDFCERQTSTYALPRRIDFRTG